MAIAHIQMIYCISPSSGTDAGFNQAIAALPETVLVSQLGAGFTGLIPGLAAIINAIDQTRQDPDNVFISTDTTGDLDNAIWPGNRQDVDMRAGQSVNVNIRIPFSFSLNISLWDFDTISRNDLLGSFTIFEQSDTRAGTLARKAANPLENSAYYVLFEVQPGFVGAGEKVYTPIAVTKPMPVTKAKRYLWAIEWNNPFSNPDERRGVLLLSLVLLPEVDAGQFETFMETEEFPAVEHMLTRSIRFGPQYLLVDEGDGFAEAASSESGKLIFPALKSVLKEVEPLATYTVIDGFRCILGPASTAFGSPQTRPHQVEPNP
jgi:hypothetical protein